MGWRTFKKFACIICLATFVLSLSGCSWNDPEKTENDGVFKVALVPDTGGINDQSFNQSAYEGLCELRDEIGAQISYVESKQFTDYALNLDKLADGPSDLIIAVGNTLFDAVEEVAAKNLDKNFVNVDYAFGDDIGNNVTGIMFKAQDAAFIVGYIAGMTTKTNKVGFVGGMRNPIIDQFEYGFSAGVYYASKERNIPIEVVSQYAESFSDAAKGRVIASRMYSNDCDIVFHAAGGVGHGVIEEAKERNKLVIGVDRDQAYLAPKNVLTSAVKNVGAAVKLISKKLIAGEKIGGQNFEFGLSEKCVGIPEHHENMDDAIYNKALKLSNLIESGKIVVPLNEKTFNEFKENLVFDENALN